jgi:integrase
MGIFQRYIKKDRDGKPVLDKNGKPKREGPWFIQYPHARDSQTGKIRYRTEKGSFSKKKAENLFRVKNDAFTELERFGTQIDHEMGFNEFMDWGLRQEVMQAKASIADDVTRAEHLKAYFGNCRAVQVTPLMVDNFRKEMRRTNSSRTKRPFSGTTINKMVTLARRIYYLGTAAGKVNSNPFARRGVFKEEPKGKYIPAGDFWKIHGFLPDYLKSVVVTAYFTGMRLGEVLGLEWDRIDLFNGCIDLTPADTKTDEPRRLYFNSIPELKAVFIEKARERKTKQGTLFVKPDGGPVNRRLIQRHLKKACAKAGVGPYRFHDLRHTFNTNMNKAGVDRVVTMKLTGHKTLHMFLRYSHLDKEQSEGAMEKLNKFLSPQGKAEPETAAHDQTKNEERAK